MMMNLKIAFCLLLLPCTNIAFPQGTKTAFINGKVCTVNKNFDFEEAVITENGKIIFVGNNKDAKKYIDQQTTVVDLGGKLMLPGFIDNHTHFAEAGFNLMQLNLRAVKTAGEFSAAVNVYVNQHSGEWIEGGDWDHEKWDKKVLPHKGMIDEFSSNTPILINRYDGHMALANSYALKLAGIDKNTPSPEGGIIEKDPETGEPTGILKDFAIDLVRNIIPKKTTEQYKQAVLKSLEVAKENGFTSIQDITMPETLKTYRELNKGSLLTCRIYTRLPISEYQGLVKEGIKYNSGDARLKMGSLKAYADGSLGSATALFFDDYLQAEYGKGISSDIVANGNLAVWAMDADRHQLQLSIHAIGDSANYMILKMFEQIKRENPPWDRRSRIEHAQHVRPQDISTFSKLGVIASAQPAHLLDDGNWAEKRIGARIKDAYPLRSFLDNNVLLCFGSDWNVAPLNALTGIYAAVTRITSDGKNPGGWIPEQRITVKEAVKCYTINNAYAAFEEGEKGSIEVGKLADLVVLSDDIFTIAPQKIKDVKVEMTIFDGKTIYTRKP